MSEARRFFDAIARRYDREYALSGTVSRERMTRVLDHLDGKTSVLVLGIGTGRELPPLLDAGHVVTGIDISPAMVTVLERRSRTAPVTIADFWEPLPFESASFDAAIALHGTLAHPPEPKGVAALTALSKELARVLVRGGTFVAEVPLAEGLARIAGEGPITVTGPTSFLHRDEASGEAIAGIALSANGWCDALGAALGVVAEPLGDVEALLVGRA